MNAANRTFSELGRTARNGFTLIELVVVMLIVGIVASVATPTLTTAIEQQRAEAAGRRIVMDLNYARNDAMTRSQNRMVTFNLGANRYDLVGVIDPDTPSNTTYSVDLATTGYPASLISVDFDTLQSVTFNMYGQPFTAASPLAANGTIVVTSGSETRTVVVDSVSGKAVVQ